MDQKNIFKTFYTLQPSEWMVRNYKNTFKIINKISRDQFQYVCLNSNTIKLAPFFYLRSSYKLPNTPQIILSHQNQSSAKIQILIQVSEIGLQKILRRPQTQTSVQNLFLKIQNSLLMLAKKYGYFKVTENIIKFTNYQHLLIWINSSFLSNFREHPLIVKNQKEGCSQMIKDLAQIFMKYGCYVKLSTFEQLQSNQSWYESSNKVKKSDNQERRTTKFSNHCSFSDFRKTVSPKKLFVFSKTSPPQKNHIFSPKHHQRKCSMKCFGNLMKKKKRVHFKTEETEKEIKNYTLNRVESVKIDQNKIDFNESNTSVTTNFLTSIGSSGKIKGKLDDFIDHESIELEKKESLSEISTTFKRTPNDERKKSIEKIFEDKKQDNPPSSIISFMKESNTNEDKMLIEDFENLMKSDTIKYQPNQIKDLENDFNFIMNS